MLRHDLSCTLRDIARNRLYAIVTVAGLAVGIASSLLIFVWIVGEFSYDRFHEKGDRIHRILAEDDRDDTAAVYWATSIPLASALRGVQGVADATALRPFTLVAVRGGGRFGFERRFVFTDEAFLRVFSFPLLRGDPATALSRRDAVVLTASAAARYFGDEDPVGRLIEVNDGNWFIVTGVAADPPANSSIRFSFLARLENIPSFYPFMEIDTESWDVHSVMTFVLLEEGADREAVDASVRNILGGRVSSFAAALRLQPLRDVHLRSARLSGVSLPWRGDIRFVALFAGIGLFILLLACVNAVNLATARAGQRLRSIALRKAAGAAGADILRLLSTEAVVLTVLAGALAAVAVELFLPRFGRIAGVEPAFDGTAAPWFALLAATAVATAVAVAGVLPVVALARDDPAAILHGRTVAGRSGARMRRILVVAQFAIAISLLVATATVSRQIDYILGCDPGFDTERLYTAPIDRGTAGRFDDVRRRLLADPAVEAVAAASNDPVVMSHYTTGAFSLEGRTDPLPVLISYLSASPSFLDLLGVQILEGSIYGADTAAAVVNEEGARRMAPAEPVGTRFDLFWPGRIVGVCADFHFESFHHRIRPLLLMPVSAHYKHLYIRLSPATDALDRLRVAWEEAVPGAPLEIRPVEEALGDRYVGERRLRRVFAWFSGLAVFLSCLGLFGLASFTAERRTKEIGIRKAVGASRARIVMMLSAEFARLVLFASLVAWPVSWLLMRRWLGGFAYATPLEPAVFIGASGLAVLVAILSVCAQALRAASVEPARALRCE